MDEKEGHGGDVLMPGFRFHPTEEELLEFYLRRKVEGKRFNVELITFLDLYRYDPWELPAQAAMGEKEWFFYVPRDRKYRNGDRPNRVTTSGYWKATGADRLIRTEGSRRPIGLKKTLVFYFGKAPRGIRTSWIMNEYRMPQNDGDPYGVKAEISLCRVYKRAGGVDDHRRLLLAGGAVSSMLSDGQDALPVPALREYHAAPSSSARTYNGAADQFHCWKGVDVVSGLSPACSNGRLAACSSDPTAAGSVGDHELNWMVGFRQPCLTSTSTQPTNQVFPLSSLQVPQLHLTSPPASAFTRLTGKLWDWS